jgi:hypothetical protein
MTFGEGRVPPRPQPQPTPDWAALAEASAAADRRRKRLLWGGGGALALVTAGAVLALTLGGGTPEQSTARPAPPTPAPSFSSAAPAGPDPRLHLSDIQRDSAPLDDATFFPGRTAEVQGRTYTEMAGDTTKDCARSVNPAVATVLRRNRCATVLRTSYALGDVATTVGVVAFETEAQAKKAKTQLRGGVLALPAKGRTFCKPGVICRRTTHTYGRYLYVTLTGFLSGKDATTEDRTVYRAGDDLAEYTFQLLLSRGRASARALY